jgi:hypothetical protein
MIRSTLLYLKDTLSFKAKEWAELSDADKATLRKWAREEMDVLKIEHD